jgi:hypothetical protein
MAFADCTSLTAFYGKIASTDNRCLVIDGVLNSFAPAGLSEYDIPDSVTEIGDYAFYGCDSLTSITIPDSVTTIGWWAFQYCTSLKEFYCKAISPPVGYQQMFSNNASGRKIYVPAESVATYKSTRYWSDYATDIVGYYFDNGVVAPIKPATNEIWYTNGSTTSKTVPYTTNAFGANIVSNTYDAEKECWVIKFDGEVTTIGKQAFFSCTSLTSITIPDSVTEIGNNAFLYCNSIQEFNGKFASEDGRCLVVDGVLNIVAPANLTSYTIPNSVTSIGFEAFRNCKSLTSITIPDSVTSIGDNAFYECTSLTSVTIPNSVTEIGDRAFCSCTSLTSITIPDSVTTIGGYAFWGCDSLTSVIIGDNVTTIGEYAFYSCDNLRSVTIPDSVTVIGDYAFYECTRLRSITIGDSVTAIGNRAFYNCYSLTSITIPDSVITVGDYAFYECRSLTSVTIGDGVISIGWQVFYACSKLTSVYCEAITPPSIKGNVFYKNASSRKIYVPSASVEAYKSATYWSDYASYIVGYDFVKGEVVDGGNNGSYTVVLNNAWRQSTSVSNPDSSLYDGVYESYSNYNVHSSSAWMYINIEGYDTFTIYVRSYAESSYDYVTVYNLDSTSSAKMTTKGNQQSGTSISSYTPVTFSNIGGGSHRIAIEYKKDSSQNSNSDRGYVIVPKNQ